MMRLPDFIIAGVRKCGTSSLHSWLSEHPQVFVPPMTKEIFFFDRLWSRGPEWYARHFDSAGPGQICGEATPSYFGHPEVAERIHDVVPDVKLIFVFRNPVRRAISMYHHMIAVGETRADFVTTASRNREIIEEGFYDRHCRRFEALFRKDQIFCLVLEDVGKNGEAALKPMFDFLGIDNSFVPPSLNERQYERREPRARGLVSLIGKTTMFLRDHGLHAVVNSAKALGAAKIFYKSEASSPEPLPADVVEQLKRSYVRDARALGNRLGRDLVSLWELEGKAAGGIEP